MDFRGAADDVEEEDRRPTQRRRIMEEAQAGGFDENMEPLVLPLAHPLTLLLPYCSQQSTSLSLASLQLHPDSTLNPLGRAWIAAADVEKKEHRHHGRASAKDVPSAHYATPLQ